MADNKSTEEREVNGDESQLETTERSEEAMLGEVIESKNNTETESDERNRTNSTADTDIDPQQLAEKGSTDKLQTSSPMDKVETNDQEKPAIVRTEEEQEIESIPESEGSVEANSTTTEKDLSVTDERLVEEGKSVETTISEDVLVGEGEMEDVREPATDGSSLSNGLQSEQQTGYRGVSRWGAFWLSAGCSGLALVIAVIITLGIVAGLNGGTLIFTTPAEMNSLTLEVDGIDTIVSSLGQDLGSLQTRVDNLEALSGRMNELENSVTEIEQEMGGVAEQVSGMEKAVQELDQKVDDLVKDIALLQETSNRFQGFFEGLRELLGNIFEMEGTQ
jgi:hypothetical protein